MTSPIHEPNPLDRDKLKELIDQGLNWQEIGDALGVGRGHAWNWANYYGLVKRRGRKSLFALFLEQEGISRAEAAFEMATTMGHVNNVASGFVGFNFSMLGRFYFAYGRKYPAWCERLANAIEVSS